MPEGAIVVREHATLNNSFSRLWFNEVDMVTPRDQLSFGYVAYRLGGFVQAFFLFTNCDPTLGGILFRARRNHAVANAKNRTSSFDEE